MWDLKLTLGLKMPGSLQMCQVKNYNYQMYLPTICVIKAFSLEGAVIEIVFQNMTRKWTLDS